MTVTAPASTCARNLPQHFNGCACVSRSDAVTAEANLDLTPTAAAWEPERPALPDWDAPAGTDTRNGSFDRCKPTSAAYTAFLQDQGLDASWVQVVGPRGSFPDAHPSWKGIEKYFWQHYVTEVTGPDGVAWHVDWTARQFDPSADYPKITVVDGDDWDEQYSIRDEAMRAYLDEKAREQRRRR
jgi:hypothetical protein